MYDLSQFVGVSIQYQMILTHPSLSSLYLHEKLLCLELEELRVDFFTCSFLWDAGPGQFFFLLILFIFKQGIKLVKSFHLNLML